MVKTFIDQYGERRFNDSHKRVKEWLAQRKISKPLNEYYSKNIVTYTLNNPCNYPNYRNLRNYR